MARPRHGTTSATRSTRGPSNRTRADDTQWPCGMGSGFDMAPRKVAGWSHKRHYFVTRRKWGNTRSAKQCDRDWAGSNGYVYFIGLGTGG